MRAVTRYARVAALAGLMMAGFSATAEARCVFVTWPTVVTFGNYSVFQPTPLEVTSSVQIQCNPNSSGTLTLTRSSTSNSYTPRMMARGAELMPYNVFLDAAGTEIFGDGNNGTTVSVSVNAEPQDKNFIIPMYFQAVPGSDIFAGTYTDTLTLTVNPVRGGNPASYTFTVTAIVVPECQVSSFTMPFGNYDPVGAHATTPLDASTLINVFCTKGVTGQTALSAGNNPSGANRQLAFGANRLLYNVFIESGRTTIWNTTNRITGTSTSKLIPIGGGLAGYGRIPAGQSTVPPGSYFDTLVATVTY